MSRSKDILLSTAHRPWPLLAGPWAFYQEWNRALFLHWRVPAELIQPMIPRHTSLDLFDGSAWISLVAFTMQKIRPRSIPPFPPVSTFHEVNVRTYVSAQNKPGIYFLSIEAGKRLSTWISAAMSGLPYEYASMQRHAQMYTSRNKTRNFQLDASYTIARQIVSKSPLEVFLTEKYCLYMQKAGSLYRYEVHHRPWDLHTIEFSRLITDYKIGQVSLQQSPALTHYSEGVQVLAWKPGRVEDSITYQ